MKKIIILLCFISSISFFAQQDGANTLKNQFDALYKKSTSYQKYKVIKKQHYIKLKQNDADSSQVVQKKICEKEQIILQSTTSGKDLQEKLDTSTK